MRRRASPSAMPSKSCTWSAAARTRRSPSARSVAPGAVSKNVNADARARPGEHEVEALLAPVRRTLEQHLVVLPADPEREPARDHVLDVELRPEREIRRD